MEHNNFVNEKEREINVKVMNAYVLWQWRKVLIIMLVFSVLAIGYKAYKSKGTVATSNEAETVTVNEQQEAVKKEIESTQASIKTLNDYIKNSVYASIDPYNEVETKSYIAVVTGSETNNSESMSSYTNHANQIAQAYTTYILNDINYDDIASKVELNSDYVKELIDAKPNFDTDTITLKVIGTDSKQTELIAEYIVEQIDSEETQIKSKYGEHSIVISKINTNNIVDSSLLSTQTASNTSTSYSNNVAMTQAVTRLNTLKANLTAEETTLKNIGSTTNSSNLNISPKTLLKYGLIGLIGGMALAVIFYAIKFVLNNKIFSEDDVKTIYDLKILSVFPMNLSRIKLSKFDSVACRQIDSAYGIGKDVAIEKAMMNISGYAGDKKSILLIGSDLKQNLDELQVKLQALNKDIKFSVSNNINADSNELAKLKDTDGVIVVAERNQTRIDDLTKSVETIYNWNKEIVGSIVL